MRIRPEDYGGRSKPGGQGVTKALVRAVSDPRDVSVGPDQRGSGSRNRAEHRELPHPGVSSVDPSNPLHPWIDVEGARLTEIEKDRSSLVQQGEDPPWAAFGDQVEIPVGPPPAITTACSVMAGDCAS
jgi:hypothetical protein